KEGRTFVLAALLASQRGCEVGKTTSPQGGRLRARRSNSPTDRGGVQPAPPEGVSGTVAASPLLRTGPVLLAGEAVRLPMRCRFKLPRDGHFPDSKDPVVAAGWSEAVGEEDYSALVSAWRNQDPSATLK